MQNLNLNDLLRYGFAGAVFLMLTVAAFENPQILLTKDYANSIVAAALLGVGFTVGCILYALHRAVSYPVLYFIFAKLTRRTNSTLELDITRWKNSSKVGALQPRMADWGAQVHFLYCVAWAGFASLLLGQLKDWKTTKLWLFVLLASVLFLASALWHHYRYQKWERRIFEEDRAPKAS